MSQSKSQPKLKLGAFIQATGHHIAAWRHPGSQADSGVNIDHYQQVAQTAERGKFDLVFLADSPGVWERGDSEAFGRQGRVAVFEPVTLFSALSATTRHIGFVSTASTTYEEPYTLARKFASLDHISKGRAAWNVVTTGNESAAGNFGKEEHLAHSLRYERAEEFLDVVKGLWDSFDDDAFQRNKESGVYFDTQKVHKLNYKGKYFSVTGPLNISRPPQGYPVIVQAGASDAGRELAARTAEVIFTAWQTLEEAQAFYSDIKGRLAKYGRHADELKIMPGLSPVIGRTQEEADAKFRQLQDLIHPSVGYGILQRFFPGVDLSQYDLDGPPPPFAESTNGNTSRLALVTELAQRDKLTLRQLYERLAGARGHRVVVGTPEKVADEIQLWFENGAADGFNIMPPILPESLDTFVELVIPILQQRGLFRTEYEGATLRENLGLRRPESQYVVGDEEESKAA
ncbi:Nitrilotriacetate monooxygenase component A [Andreprevotia sp. IGB-42]|uniref:LLM class flavin-dependent oxidoreductase n=1 Tax=Andreprevotia sp. IGB-42 TaxID=2497473 RepID=UPI0013582F7C|nr:LLM class flavin-dependent oxidoreductase [Andreprevotia sp. IGB-42]KAF0815142.1 Nitrilotriacetate monooxygenase component A [Andreprevotia sp. IGB-42]